MQSGIYKITHVKSGRFYIGSAKSIKARWSTHRQDLLKNKHHSKYLQAIYNKYGKDSIIYEIIEHCELNELLIREQHYIDTLQPTLNMVKTAGSPKGYKHSEEVKIKQAERQRGRKVTFSEEALANIREGVKSRVLTDEGRASIVKHMSARMKGSKQKPESIAKTVAFHTGRKRSEETKRKISENRKGKQVSPEGLAKMKAKMQSPEMREHLSKLAKGRVAHNKGVPMSDAQKKHLSKLKMGVPLSEEHKRKLRESHVVGHKHSDLVKLNISRSKAKFNETEMGEVRKLRSSGKTLREIAQLYNVSSSTIGQVLKPNYIYKLD